MCRSSFNYEVYSKQQRGSIFCVTTYQGFSFDVVSCVVRSSMSSYRCRYSHEIFMSDFPLPVMPILTHTHMEHLWRTEDIR